MKNMQRFIDTKLNFQDVNSAAKNSNKTPRQVFLERQEQLERMNGIQSTLIKDFARQTNFFKDGAEGQFPVDAFQILDLTINLPLNKFWAQELVPIRYGGGASESIAYFRQNVALSEGRLAGGNTNEIPLVGITDEKIVGPIYAIKLGILLGAVDLMKAETINYDLLERHEMALRTSYWREIEQFAFVGNLGIAGITTSSDAFKGGLLNQPTALVGYEALTDAQWTTYDVNDFVGMFVGAVAQMKQDLRFNRDFFPNKVLVPPTLMTAMQNAALVGELAAGTGAGVATSIFEYIRQEVRNRLSIDVVFEELPYLDAGAAATQGFFVEQAGANSTGRVVIYRQDEKVIKLPITMALTGGAALPSPTEDGIRKNYVAFAGPLLVVYPETIYYIDNKAA
jgi:hypothetical protein